MNLLEEYIDACREKKDKVIVVGDFNADLNRMKYKNDFKVSRWVAKTNVTMVKHVNHCIKYTFCSGNNKSFIDYCMIDSHLSTGSMKLMINQNQ